MQEAGSRKLDRRIRLQAINLPPSVVSVGFQSFHNSVGAVGRSFLFINERRRRRHGRAGICLPLVCRGCRGWSD